MEENVEEGMGKVIFGKAIKGVGGRKGCAPVIPGLNSGVSEVAPNSQ